MSPNFRNSIRVNETLSVRSRLMSMTTNNEAAPPPPVQNVAVHYRAMPPLPHGSRSHVQEFGLFPKTPKRGEEQLFSAPRRHANGTESVRTIHGDRILFRPLLRPAVSHFTVFTTRVPPEYVETVGYYTVSALTYPGPENWKQPVFWPRVNAEAV